jgi:hypothetical protein
MSALIYLKDPGNPVVYRKTHDLLRYLRDEGIYGISAWNSRMPKVMLLMEFWNEQRSKFPPRRGDI